MAALNPAGPGGVFCCAHSFIFMDQRFMLRCSRCRWARLSTGVSTDLQDLHEYKKCANCGGPRKFRCPQCGGQAKMLRIKGNDR